MLFQSRFWRDVESHYPILTRDLPRFRAEAVTQAQVGMAIVLWFQAMRDRQW